MTVTVAKRTLGITLGLSGLFFLSGFLTASQITSNEIKNLRSIAVASKTASDIVNASIHDHIIADRNVTTALQERLDELHDSDWVTIQELRNQLKELNDSHLEMLKIINYHFTNKLKKEYDNGKLK